MDPGDQLKQVLTFRQDIARQKELLFQEFDGLEAFQANVRSILSQYVLDLWDAEFKHSETASPSDDNVQTSADVDRIGVPSTHSQYKVIAQFLQDFSDKLKADGETPAHNVGDVARLRVISSSMSLQGNDSSAVGVHDANILYQAREQIRLTNRESSQLIFTSLEHYEHENMPLWHWLASRLGTGYLTTASLFTTDDGAASGALNVMRDAEEPIPLTVGPSRDVIVERWLDNQNSGRIRTASLAYLARCGIPNDLSILFAELRKEDSTTAKAAVRAIVSIERRRSATAALKTLIGMQPSNIDEDIVADFLSNADSLPSDLLNEVLSSHSSKMRSAALALLIQRGALKSNVAEQLLSDPSPEVRLESMLFLSRDKQRFSDADAKELLAQEPPRLGVALYGNPGRDDTYYRLFMQRQRELKSNVELLSGVESGIFGPEGEILLARRDMSRYGEKLRESIRGHFADDFQRYLERLRLNSANELVVAARSAMEDSARRGM